MQTQPFKSQSARVFLAACAVLAIALGACGDDAATTPDAGDGDKAGSGAGSAAGKGGGGAGTGSAGTGTAGGAAGTAGEPLPDPADVAIVCKTFTDCNSIPGQDLTEERCAEDIDKGCTDCAIAHVDDETEENDAGVACAVDTKVCSIECSQLVAPPKDTAECLEIQATSLTPMSDEYNECLCTTCLDPFAACKGDAGCWKIIQCALRTNCTLMGCYQPGTCMDVINEVGAQSLATMMSTQLGMCTAKCPK